MLTEKELAYAAGIVDGEGCLTLHSRYKYGLNVHQLEVTVTNTCDALISWLIARFGGTAHKRPGKAGYWKVYRVSEQVAFIKAILPYLLVKRRQAELLLAYRDTVGPIGPAVSPDVVKLRKEIVREVYSLNGATAGKPSRNLA